MQKLLTDLRQLLVDKRCGGIQIGEIIIDTYRVQVRVMCELFNPDHSPSKIPGSYSAKVQIHNTLTQGTIHSEQQPDYKVLSDLREKIVQMVERAIEAIMDSEKTKQSPYPLADTYTKEERVKKWYQQEMSLTRQQLDFL